MTALTYVQLKKTFQSHKNDYLDYRRISSREVFFELKYISKHSLSFFKLYMNFLTLFFPMFLFDPPENNRKTNIFLCFQWVQKGTLGSKGLNPCCILSTLLFAPSVFPWILFQFLISAHIRMTYRELWQDICSGSDFFCHVIYLSWIFWLGK